MNIERYKGDSEFEPTVKRNDSSKNLYEIEIILWNIKALAFRQGFLDFMQSLLQSYPLYSVG